MNSKNKLTLYIQVLFVSFIIPVITFLLYNVYGNDFNISLMIGVIAAIVASMSILALRIK